MKNLVKFPLNGLRAVHALARYGTLASAANELCVSPGAVSKHVLNIEEKIGHRIFERTTSGFIPISSSRGFFDELNNAFHLLAESLEKIDGAKDDQIRISSAPSFARNWLIPRLSAFNERHPGIKIHLEADRNNIDFSTTNFDCVIRFCEKDCYGPEHLRLSDQFLFPVCSPILSPILKTIQDIERVNVITSEGVGINWRLWLEGNDVAGLEFRKQLSLFDEDLCLSAAISGLGVTLSWRTQAIDAIRRGLLVVPFGTSVPTGLSYWFVIRPGARPSPSIRLFQEWLLQEMAICEGSCDFIAAPDERRTEGTKNGD